jgi:hypothetical protein
VKCSGRRLTVEVPTLASLDRSLGTGGRPHQLLVTAYCLGAGLTVVPLYLLTAWKQVLQSSCCSLLGSRSRSRRIAHCLEAGLAVVVLLTAWEQVLQSSVGRALGDGHTSCSKVDRIQNVRGCAKVADAW